MDIGSSFITYAKAAVLVQPTDSSLHDPSLLAQATSVIRAATSQYRCDSQPSQHHAVALGVIGAISLDAFRSLPARAGLAPHGGNRCHQRQELPNVVCVRRSGLGGQWDTLRIGQNMMLAAGFTAICGVRAGLVPPKTALTDDESTTARDQSILSACRRRSRSRQ